MMNRIKFIDTCLSKREAPILKVARIKQQLISLAPSFL